MTGIIGRPLSRRTALRGMGSALALPTINPRTIIHVKNFIIFFLEQSFHVLASVDTTHVQLYLLWHSLHKK